jgi:hypothetical protein
VVVVHLSKCTHRHRENTIYSSISRKDTAYKKGNAKEKGSERKDKGKWEFKRVNICNGDKIKEKNVHEE